MSKSQSLASQLCAIFPYICLQFVNGSFLGYIIIIIAELQKNDSEIPTTLDQLTWLSGFDILQPIGTVCAGLLAQRLGSRPVAFITALLLIISLLIFLYSTTIGAIISGRLLCSLFTMRAIANPYISEVSEPRFRGRLLAISELSFIIGTFFSLILGNWVYWRTIAEINLIFPVFAAVTMFITPNSPTWLATKGRLSEAEQALCRLRGWVEPEQVQTEFRTLIKTFKSSISNPDEEYELTSTNFSYTESLRKSQRPLLQRSFSTPLETMCLTVLLSSFSGMASIESHANIIIWNLTSPIASFIWGTAPIIGGLFIIFFIHRFGKRKLGLSSILITGLCFMLITILEFIKFSNDHPWTSITLIIARIANFSGIGTILYMLPCEIIPSYDRYIGTSLSISAKMVVELFIKSLFLYAVAVVTMPGVLFFFAIINFVSLVVFYFIMPETEGRSLREIENHYNSVKFMEKRENL